MQVKNMIRYMCCHAFKQCAFIHLIFCTYDIIWAVNYLLPQHQCYTTGVFRDVFTCPVNRRHAKGAQALCVKIYIGWNEAKQTYVWLSFIFYNHLFLHLRDRFLLAIRLSRLSWWLGLLDIYLAYPLANDPLTSNLSILFHDILISYGVG